MRPGPAFSSAECMASTANYSIDASDARPSKKPKKAAKQAFKLSCDACAKLKIRCPKQQPSCEQCLRKDRTCTYSAAQRYGKRKATKKGDEEKHGILDSEAPTHSRHKSTSTSTSGQSNKARTSRGPAEMNATMFHGPIDPSFTQTPMFDSIDDWPFAGHMFPDTNQFQARTPVMPSIETDSASALPTMHDYMPSPHIWPGSLSTTHNLAQAYCSPASTQPSVEDCAIKAMPEPVQSAHPPSEHTSQDCFQRACEAFRYLKTPSKVRCVFEKSPSAANTPPTILEDVGTMLERTEQAVYAASLILRCPCHKTSKVRCALTLLLFEVVSWYERVAKELIDDQNPRTYGNSPHNSDTKSHTSSRSRSTDSSQSSIVVPQVRIGSTTIGAADSSGMLSQLLLLKMKKIRVMIQSLSMPHSPASYGGDVLDRLAVSLETEMLRDVM